MTIQQLQYLQEVYRAGSILQAAKNLYVAQSSISSSISALEKELGYPVFLRDRQGVHPTTQGLAVLEEAARICDSYRRITHKELTLHRHIRIRATAYAPFSNAFMRLVGENIRRSDLTFSLVNASAAASVVDQLSMFELDLSLAVTMVPVHRSQRALYNSRGLRLELGHQVPAVVRLGPGHPLYDKAQISLSDLKEHLLVDTAQGSWSLDGHLSHLLALDASRTLFVSEQRTRYELVSRGLAYSLGFLLPEEVNRQYGFRSIPLAGMEFRTCALSNPARFLEPEIERFRELADEEIASLVTPSERPIVV